MSFLPFNVTNERETRPAVFLQKKKKKKKKGKKEKRINLKIYFERRVRFASLILISAVLKSKTHREYFYYISRKEFPRNQESFD